MEHLTKETFKSKVFDFEKNAAWKFSGERPCIVDFYAEWCGPCKMLGPVLAELAEKYSGKLDIYKVNIDSEPELSDLFRVESVPTLFFVPLCGKPAMASGVMQKAA
ncbi:MAG: thioredoxin domain-containing protein, partial [Elusimicrobiaceae bacterium]